MINTTQLEQNIFHESLMAKLYFLDRQFDGISMVLDEALKLEYPDRIHLLYHDSWHSLHYNFFNCRDAFACEISTFVRAHLYNLAAGLYMQFENVRQENLFDDARLKSMINELIEIADYSRTFPISYWTYGDDLSRARLEERFSGLPSAQQIDRLLEIPCFIEMQYMGLHHTCGNEAFAKDRYLKEEDAYKKRLSGNEGAAV
jgi:hypothetical protein